MSKQVDGGRGTAAQTALRRAPADPAIMGPVLHDGEEGI
jgi:hypothetical protein